MKGKDCENIFESNSKDFDEHMVEGGFREAMGLQ
jgi:hypothetical protein